MAAADRNAEQEQSIEFLQQIWPISMSMLLKKGKSIEKMEKLNYQLRPELEKLEHYNQYLAKECRKQESVIDQKKDFS